MNNLDRDIVLFLGAGFSKNADLPTMAEFGAESKRDDSDLRRLDRYAVPLLVSAADTFLGFQKILENDLSIKQVNNMETIFCIAEAIQESGIENIEINGNLKEIAKLIEEIRLWLWKVYQQYPPENPKRTTDIKVLENFFRIIKNLKIQDKITVLSTNYDLVYEYCSYQSEIPCAYPLFWDTDFRAGFGHTQFISQFDESEGKTLVCKLHGSVNFFENSTENKERLSIVSDLGNEQAIGKSGKWNNRPALFAVDSIWNIRNKYGNGYVPAIIPPTYAKLRGYSWLREIWKVAFEAVKNANKIIFIGYSFPESDGFIQAFFRGALAMRKNNLKPEINLIDPQKKIHRRYKKYFKSNFKQNNPLFLKDAINEGAIYDLLKR